MTAFVLGNGVSRAGIDPRDLEKIAPVYGCNAIYRTYAPQVLVATDRGIAEAIEDSGYSQQYCFYTRRPRPGTGAQPVPRKYFGYSSGPIAVALAAEQRYSPLYLLGFDMGPNQQGRFNNIYAGSEFYKPTDAAATFSGNWIRQLVGVAHNYPDTEFVRVCGDTTAKIEELAVLSNMTHMPLVDFEHLINKIRGI